MRRCRWMGLTTFGVLVAALLASQLAYAQATILFDLPAQPLADALRAVGHQAQINVLFDPSLVDAVRAPALKASLTADQAFARLLARTPLKYRFLDDRTVTIIPASAVASERAKAAVAVDAQVGCALH